MKDANVLRVVVFTALVGALIASVVLTGPMLDSALQQRVDNAVAEASRRRFVGRHVRRVGDDHPWSTSLLAAVISPVFAVLLARLLHPGQALRRTGVIATVAYAVPFAVVYYSLGAGAGAIL